MNWPVAHRSNLGIAPALALVFLTSLYFVPHSVTASPFTVPPSAGDSQRESNPLAVHFEQEIRPVLVNKCIECHGEHKQEGGLRLDTAEGLLAGGDSGPTIIPGKPEESILIDAIHHRGFEMPPTGKLADKSIEQLEKWVLDGAFWPETVANLRPSDSAISAADRSWWAFAPLNPGSVPELLDDDWSQNEIDKYVLSKHRENGLTPAPAADKVTLIRRLYLDLVGIPPTPTEIDAFVNDTSSNAVELVVDRLLEDPKYGEHWARFWLDLVRFSESDGWNKDSYRPLLWQYRDYVVNAFNKDMPYTQFVMDQLAGDEYVEPTPDGIIASGFMRLGVYEYNQRNARGQWNDIMNEMTDVAGEVFFGVSVSCARCHNHKFDPIPQVDYFKLRAFFEPVIWRDDVVAATSEEKREYEAQLKIWEDKTVHIRAKIAAILEPYEKKRTKDNVALFPVEIQACFNLLPEERTSWQEQMAYLVQRQYWDELGGPYSRMSKEDIAARDELQKELAAFDDIKPKPLRPAMTVADHDGIISPTRIPDDPLKRIIKPGFLEVLDQVEGLPQFAPAPARAGSTGNRTALARWITHPKNPLTTRVIVNRIWQQHFGEGLVGTSSDFGQLGDAPSHPELLDWLTQEFINGGWTFKSLHKRILLSATWQQSARHPEAEKQEQIDGENRFVWRADVRRLKAEQIRDAMLVATRELSSTVGGPSVKADQPRRSIYLQNYRNQNDTFLHSFDMANGLQSVAVRDITTTPMQSLLLLNGSYTRDRAKVFADKLLAEHSDRHIAVHSAFRWAWGKAPNDSEFQLANDFLAAGTGEDSHRIDTEKFVDFCHVLFNSNQFLYLE